MIFDYPNPHTERRHAPAGYASYQKYRPWLRDEFDFRCAYCLKREQWGQFTGEFDIDHFKPQKTDPEAQANYPNLVYACHRCNLVKLDQPISVPVSLLNFASVDLLPDGALAAQSDDVKRLIGQLDLNSEKLQDWRLTWMRIVELAETYDTELFERLVSLPDDLPNLSRLKPPTNSLPGGVQESWFAKRSRGEACRMA